MLPTGQKLGVRKRYLHHTEELLGAHPEFLDHHAPSLDARLDIVKAAVPELAAAASRRAIAEWGRPAADITDLVVATSAGAHVPGADFRLARLLGLRPSVRRTMLYLSACYAGAAALRLAKDVAENNRGARVLVVCAELTLPLFEGPGGGQFNTLVNQGFFADGAGPVVERPLFEIVSAAQTIIPGTEDAIDMLLTKDGLALSSTSNKLPEFIGGVIQQCLRDSFSPLGVVDPEWNDLFWVLHPGNPGILDRVDAVLQLKPGKLAASRYVLSEFGNMFGATVLFVLDEMRKRMAMAGAEQELQWGVLMAFGPGMTTETMVLRVPRNQ